MRHPVHYRYEDTWTMAWADIRDCCSDLFGRLAVVTLLAAGAAYGVLRFAGGPGWPVLAVAGGWLLGVAYCVAWKCAWDHMWYSHVFADWRTRLERRRDTRFNARLGLPPPKLYALDYRLHPYA